MSVTAFILMVLVQGTVTILTGYFFWRVLRTPPKAEPDSYENEL
jgi:hypothetical protein